MCIKNLRTGKVKLTKENTYEVRYTESENYIDAKGKEWFSEDILAENPKEAIQLVKDHLISNGSSISDFLFKTSAYEVHYGIASTYNISDIEEGFAYENSDSSVCVLRETPSLETAKEFLKTKKSTMTYFPKEKRYMYEEYWIVKNLYDTNGEFWDSVEVIEFTKLKTRKDTVL